MDDVRKSIEDHGRLPSDILLGHIVFTTGGGFGHDREELVTRFKELNLSTDHIPDVPRAVDAFKRAVERHDEYMYDISPLHRARISIRPASSRSTEIVERPLLREVITQDRPRRDYSLIGSLRLYRAPRDPDTRRVDEQGARMSVQITTQLSELDAEHLTELAMLIRSEFDLRRKSLDGDRIRRLIRGHLREEFHAVRLKDSANFIPVTFEKELHNFAQAISELDGCFVHLVPLVALRDQRRHIISALEEQTMEQLKGLNATIQGHRRKDKVPAFAYSRTLKEYNLITERLKHYEQEFDIKLNTVGNAVNTATAGLAALSRKLQTKGA